MQKKIEINYSLNGHDRVTETIEVPDGMTPGQAAIAHAKAKGSRWFPTYTEII